MAAMQHAAATMPPVAPPTPPQHPSPRIRLRQFRLSDADVFHPSMSCPVAMAFESHRPHDSLAQTHQWVRSVVRQTEGRTADQRTRQFVIERRLGASQVESLERDADSSRSSTAAESDFVPVGRVSLYADSFGQYQIGYLVFPSYWRQGYATEALGTLLDWTFRNGESPGEESGSEDGEIRGGDGLSLTADVDPRNAASLGLLREKFAFTSLFEETASAQVGDEMVDSIYLSLNQSAFEKCGWREDFLSRYSSLPIVHMSDDPDEEAREAALTQSEAEDTVVVPSSSSPLQSTDSSSQSSIDAAKQPSLSVAFQFLRDMDEEHELEVAALALTLEPTPPLATPADAAPRSQSPARWSSPMEVREWDTARDWVYDMHSV